MSTSILAGWENGASRSTIPVPLAMQPSHPRRGAAATRPMSYSSMDASALPVPSRHSCGQAEVPGLRSTISGNGRSIMSCCRLLTASTAWTAWRCSSAKRRSTRMPQRSFWSGIGLFKIQRWPLLVRRMSCPAHEAAFPQYLRVRWSRTSRPVRQKWRKARTTPGTSGPIC